MPMLLVFIVTFSQAKSVMVPSPEQRVAMVLSISKRLRGVSYGAWRGSLRWLVTCGPDFTYRSYLVLSVCQFVIFI
jgi:hypothetical protein